MKNNKVELIIGSIFAIIGISMIALALFLKVVADEFREISIETEAVITTIEYDREDDFHDVYVTYVFEEETYLEKLNYYSSSMSEGDTITISVDESNPTNIGASGFLEYLGAIIVGSMGLLFTIIGGSFLLFIFNKKKKYKRIRETGRRIEAKIVSVNYNTRYTINGRHPYILLSSYEENGLTYSFTSHNIWYEIESVIQNRNIETIPVYVEQGNFKKYIVDTSEIEMYLGN